MSQLAKVLSFSRKRHVDENIPFEKYEKIKESYKFIKRANGKPLSIQDMRVLDLLTTLTVNQELIFIDYHWMQQKLERSQWTVKRTFENLNHLFKFKLARSLIIDDSPAYNKIIIKRSENYSEILKNAFLEFEKAHYSKRKTLIKTTHNSEQKCSELRAEMLDAYIEDNITKENNNTVIVLKDIHDLESKQKNAENEFSFEPIEAAQENSNEKDLTDDKSLELQQKLNSTFDSETLDKINQELTFKHILPDRVHLIFTANNFFSDSQKHTLRQIIHQIYGPNTRITRGLSQPGVETLPQTNHHETQQTKGFQDNSHKNSNKGWGKVRQHLIDHILDGNLLVKSWFDKLKIEEDNQAQKLCLSGSKFMIESIINKFKSPLEEALKANNYFCELRGIANPNDPTEDKIYIISKFR